MCELIFKYCTFNRSLSHDLAQRISAMSVHGKIAIVADKPSILLSTTKKQWLKLLHQAQRERSSTLNVIRVNELSKRIAWMQSRQFSAKAPGDLLEADVVFATAEDFVITPPVCSTVFVTYAFSKAKLRILISQMPTSGTVLIYEQN